jgi:hypothetical protein
MQTEAEQAPTRFPVSVLMERRLARSGPWSESQWECIAVVAGEQVVNGAAGWTLISDDGQRTRYMWSGLQVALDRDGCESYWHNLQNDTPYLFVICFPDEGAQDESMAVLPVRVSASQDEANAAMESEGMVFSVPMPDKAIDWLERFVVANYEPAVKKKRKRRDWAQESKANAKARRPDRLH